jgi:hypothetical protein
MSGGSLTADAQVGLPVSQGQAGGGSITLQGAGANRGHERLWVALVGTAPSRVLLFAFTKERFGSPADVLTLRSRYDPLPTARFSKTATLDWGYVYDRDGKFDALVVEEFDADRPMFVKDWVLFRPSRPGGAIDEAWAFRGDIRKRRRVVERGPGGYLLPGTDPAEKGPRGGAAHRGEPVARARERCGRALPGEEPGACSTRATRLARGARVESSASSATSTGRPTAAPEGDTSPTGATRGETQPRMRPGRGEASSGNGWGGSSLFTPHDLRSTFTFSLVMRDVALEAVQELLGPRNHRHGGAPRAPVIASVGPAER